MAREKPTLYFPKWDFYEVSVQRKREICCEMVENGAIFN